MYLYSLIKRMYIKPYRFGSTISMDGEFCSRKSGLVFSYVFSFSQFDLLLGVFNGVCMVQTALLANSFKITIQTNRTVLFLCPSLRPRGKFLKFPHPLYITNVYDRIVPKATICEEAKLLLLIMNKENQLQVCGHSLNPIQ